MLVFGGGIESVGSEPQAKLKSAVAAARKRIISPL
jgi:hypothetical protein